MKRLVSSETVLFLQVIERENFSVMRKVVRDFRGVKSMLVFYVNGEWRMHVPEVYTLQEAQEVLASVALRAVLDMTDEEADVLSAKFPELFPGEIASGLPQESRN